jgi:hypothetical protein
MKALIQVLPDFGYELIQMIPCNVGGRRAEPRSRLSGLAGAIAMVSSAVVMLAVSGRIVLSSCRLLARRLNANDGKLRSSRVYVKLFCCCRVRLSARRNVRLVLRVDTSLIFLANSIALIGILRELRRGFRSWGSWLRRPHGLCLRVALFAQ